MILETERLIIAPLAADDAPLLYPFLSDAEVMANRDNAAVYERLVELHREAT